MHVRLYMRLTDNAQVINGTDKEPRHVYQLNLIFIQYFGQHYNVDGPQGILIILRHGQEAV